MRILVSLLLALWLGGCAVVAATQQPPKKNLALLSTGTPRQSLITEFGAPARVKQVEGRSAEIFDFVDGYTETEKIGRAAAHGVADVATLFLWELAGTPLENANSGRRMLVQVTYDDAGLVDQVVYLKAE